MALKLPVDQKILNFKAVKKINGFYSLCFFVGHCTNNNNNNDNDNNNQDQVYYFD